MNKKIVIKNVVLRYPNLSRKREDTSGNNRLSKYGTSIVISKNDTETLAIINEAINDALAAGNLSDTDGINLPLREGDFNNSGDRIIENSLYFYASSFIKPKVVDKKLNKTLLTDEYMHGQYVNVSLTFSSYNVNGKKGVSAQLLNVQYLGKSRFDELSSDPADDFDVEK